MKLQGKIGLVGGIGLVIGGVIGLGVYVFIPSIAAKTGSTIWLAISTALFISLLGVLPVIQISSALPVAGGGYMWCSRLLSPVWGVLVSNWALFGGCCSVCVVSVGMADYLHTYYDTGLSVHMFSMVLVLLFYTIYWFGLRLQTTFQVILSAQMILALLLYLLAVGFGTEGEFVIATKSSGNFVGGLALAFNVCFGFQVITEMGEEMKDPRRNIPLALLFGSLAILVLYVGISLAYIKVMGPDLASLAAVDSVASFHPPLIQSAADNSGSWLVALLLLGAVGAGLTSLNAGAMALPREIFSQARDYALPKALSKIHPRTQTPLLATTAFFAVVVVILIIGQIIDSIGVIEKYFNDKPTDFYGIMTVFGIMLLTLFVSISAFRLPTLYPVQYKNAYFRLPKPLLYLIISFSILSSAGFMVLLYTEAQIVAFIYIGLTLLILGYYFYRKNMLAKRGITIGTTHDILADEHDLDSLI